MNKKEIITILVCTLFMVFSLGACGKTKEDEAVVTQQESSIQIESIDEEMTFEDMPAGETETDLILEKLVGEYEYVSDYGKGSLTIKKEEQGYSIDDYESETSYRFLAYSSDIEYIKNNRIYINYPDKVYSDDTVVFCDYILEYYTDEIRVYCNKSANTDEQFLYCATKKEENQGVNENSEMTSEESTTFNNGEEDDIELKDTIEIDFTYDYTEDIKADVAYVVSNSSSLQEELKNIDTITQKYTLLAESALTQGEMNVASQWLYVIWDTELNNLWSRFSSLANQDTKEMVLEEQRNWIAMKEEVTLMSLGSQEENGSMYPMLVNSLWEEKTKNRAYFIANELAQIEGESFAMPEASTKYGLFVDNQGTDAVYSSLITQQSWEGEDEAIISVYRLGEIEGSFIDNGNGNLDFTSDDGSIKGTIQINGWNGATFEVTETIGAVPFSVGEKFEFPFAF